MGRFLSTRDRYDRHYSLKRDILNAAGAAEDYADAAIAVGPVEFIISLSDETTDLEVLLAAATFRIPHDFTLQEVRASVTTAPTDASILVSISLEGSDVINGKLTIDATEYTSEDSTVTETLATGTVTLDSGASGSVDGILVDSIEIMSGAENFDSDLSTTAANVAANITANTSTPNYTATSAGAVITIIAIAGTGAGPNGFTVVSSVTTIGTTDVNMANGVYAQAVITVSAFSDDEEIVFDIDQIGSTIAGTGLKVLLKGIRA